MSIDFPEYHKINSVFRRDKTTNRFIEGDWANEAIGYLASAPWRFTEKIDGTNIRIRVDLDENSEYSYQIGGRTDNAQIPAPLVEKLRSYFDTEVDIFGDPAIGPKSMTIYGEGYGAGIQKGGAYGLVDFIVFDVKVGKYWLEPENVREIAGKIGLQTVPEFGIMSLLDAIELVRGDKIQSFWPDVHIEGLVGVPTTQLFDKFGQRIVTKVKVRDFQ